MAAGEGPNQYEEHDDCDEENEEHPAPKLSEFGEETKKATARASFPPIGDRWQRAAVGMVLVQVGC